MYIIAYVSELPKCKLCFVWNTPKYPADLPPQSVSRILWRLITTLKICGSLRKQHYSFSSSRFFILYREKELFAWTGVKEGWYYIQWASVRWRNTFSLLCLNPFLYERKWRYTACKSFFSPLSLSFQGFMTLHFVSWLFFRVNLKGLDQNAVAVFDPITILFYFPTACPMEILLMRSSWL
jgi:hypothetical protein